MLTDLCNFLIEVKSPFQVKDTDIGISSKYFFKEIQYYD